MRIVLVLFSLALLSCGTAREERIKVVVLGFDGANWATIDPLIAKGKLPFIKQLKEEGAWASFKTDKPTKSPVVWTSIATGKTMAKHGILDFYFLKKNDIQVPFSNSAKREPSLWQMLDEFGLSSAVVNWFVTYPPDQFKGIMVSDRFRKILLKDKRHTNNYADSVSPKIDFYRLKKVVDRNQNRVFKRIQMPDFHDMYRSVHPDKNPNDSFTLKMSRTFVMQDALVENVTDELFEKKNVDLYMSYFRLPDVTQHFVLNMMEDRFIEEMFGEKIGEKAPDSEQQKQIIARISDFLEPVYAYMDRLLQKYMSQPKFKDAYFFVMSDHGFSLFKGGYNHYDLPDEMDAPDGILMVKGPTVKAGKIEAGIYDIAPTILYLYGLPVGENMDGKVLQQAFTLKRKIKYRRYLLRKQNQARPHQDADKETLEELKSLGYIE